MFGFIPRYFSTLSKSVVIAAGILFSALLGITDYLVGKELSLSFFYVIPIVFVAWYAGRAQGIGISIGSGLIWSWANFTAYSLGDHALFAYSALVSHLAFFLIGALLVAYQRKVLDRERAASRTDFLTGALNRRAFYEIAGTEIERSWRHKRYFTVAYFDLDNFKQVNDLLGHVVGDDVLRHVVTAVRHHPRATDSIARMGGDEFAILLPETDRGAAHAVVEKMRKLVLEDMQAQNWPITLSVGVLTCDQTPLSIDAIMRCVDGLMYQVKNDGKNSIVYSSCQDLGIALQAS